jgi:hypothetical protein
MDNFSWRIEFSNLCRLIHDIVGNPTKLAQQTATNAVSSYDSAIPSGWPNPIILPLLSF